MEGVLGGKEERGRLFGYSKAGYKVTVRKRIDGSEIKRRRRRER